MVMRCHYGCCSAATHRQIHIQLLQCKYGCYKPYPIPQPYPIYMVVNKHTPTPDVDREGFQTNEDQRLPVIPIPQPPDVLDLKIVGPTIQNETVVF